MSGDEYRPGGEKQESPIGWRFWLLWILASTIGFVVGGFGLILVAFVLIEVWSDTALLVLAGLITGLTLGVMQWLVLRRYIGLSKRWIIATIVGFALGEFVASVVNLIANGIPDPAFVAIVGVVMGTAQWLLLRHHVSRAAWWILATAVASAVGNNGLLAGILYGSITGGAMAWLIRRSTSDESGEFPSQINSGGG